MNNENIDRFFREKLDQVEITPSQNAWSQIEQQIHRRKTPVAYWVAASISILCLSWGIIWLTRAESASSVTPIASEINHPTPPNVIAFNIPAISHDKIEEVEPVSPQKQAIIASNQRVTKLAKSAPIVVTRKPIPTDTIASIENKETMVASVEENIQETTKVSAEEPSVKKQQFKSVKITYIAAAKPQKEKIQKTDSTKAFKKFIAFAGKLDPGNMLADIKTAKDNLLNGGLKSKKDKNSF